MNEKQVAENLVEETVDGVTMLFDEQPRPIAEAGHDEWTDEMEALYLAELDRFVDG